MGVKFTEEQQQVIDARGCNLLVSAAAGSGKTAVLVERVITRLTKEQPPLNVDQLLVVTFTDAAAAEMKTRIREAIEKELTLHPENEHLQRQAALIHQAKISTIHTFCTSVINEHFHVLDLDPSVRVGETGEIELIKRDALERVLEEAYAKGSEDFFNLVECYARGKNDTPLEELVLRLYKDSQSHPDPRAWLEQCVEQYDVESSQELEAKAYIQELVSDVQTYLAGWKEQLEYAISICESEEGPRSYALALSLDLQQLELILEAQSFGELQKAVSRFENEKLKGKKKTDVVDELKQNQVKAIRTKFLKYMDDIKSEYFSEDLNEIVANMQVARKQVKALAHLVMEFDACFVEEKRKKNVIDFNDMEHFALKILTTGDIAKGYQEKFEEIMIDEYQDINRLQDTIMTSVSGIRNGKNNLFMVGDVKQSIYRFRLSCPQLFMEKYHRYEENGCDNRRIDLHKNFRSRKEVLNSTNFIFEQVMSEDFGGIVYDESAALHVGADYEESFDKQTEVLLLDFPKVLIKQRREAEGKVLANKIKELVGKHEIYDRKRDAYRKVRYSDIAILSRNLKSVGDVYAKVLNEAGIPTHMNVKEGYFAAYEIQTVLNYLRILDNPRQDIPYTAVLASLFGKFSAEELAQIRNHNKKVGMYECVQEYLEEGADAELKERLKQFQAMFQRFRNLVPTCAIHTLLWRLLEESGFMDAMAVFPNGEQRVANLEMLIQKATSFESSSYKGLFNFVRYIEQMEKYEVENGPASLVDEQMDAVTLMTVHKSKGLEFPIVFLAQCGKDFNNKSAQGEIVVHPDIGIGVEAIEPSERTRTSTLLQKVIARKIVMESVEEEARLLYVAMTRAREKLYLLGDSDNMEKKVRDLEAVKACKEKELPYYQASSAKSYLDWILLALYRNVCMQEILQCFEIAPAEVTPLYTEEVPILVNRITWEEVVEQEAEETFHMDMTRELLRQWDTKAVYDAGVKQQLDEQFMYQYPYGDSQRIKQKISVSELKKQIYMEEGEEAYREEEVFPLLPKFLQKEQELTGASRGSAYHKVLEVLDFNKTYDEELLRQELSMLKEKGLLTEQMIGCIRLRDILLFLQSNLGLRMQAASKKSVLYAEQPFVMGMEAREIYSGSQSDEMVLIQGIIDAYFEEDGQLVVVDYKTDRVSQESELLERYHSQLEYYAEALERLTGKTVKQKVIYSFTLQQEIDV